MGGPGALVTNPFTMATMILMAEPVPAADGSGETVAAPNSAAPDAIGPAWSREDDVDDQQDTQRAAAAERESWHATWRKAGALLASGLALAAAIVVGFWVLGPHSMLCSSRLPGSQRRRTARRLRPRRRRLQRRPPPHHQLPPHPIRTTSTYRR